MTEDQHYVPQTYLRRFLNTHDLLYQISKQELEYKFHIKQFTPKGTGRSKWFYTIRDESVLQRYNTNNPNFIEDFFARNHDQHCNNILDIFPQPNLLLSIDEAKRLILFILSFKERNPVLRANFTNKESVKSVYENRLNELEADLRADNVQLDLLGLLGDRPVGDLIEKMRKAIHALIEKEEFAANVHTEGILRSISGQNTVVHEVADILLSFEWQVLVAKPDFPFITSDNPGFTVDNNNETHNLNFNEAQVFCFPLSPLHCLCLSKKQNEVHETSLHKVINNGNIEDPMLIRAINRSTYLTSHNFIYGNEKNALERTWKDIQAQ